MAFGSEHAEADVVLDALGERPQPARRRASSVACGDACETGEAICLQPHVSFCDAERERLAVVAVGSG